MNEARAPTTEDMKSYIMAEYKKGVGPKELSEKTGVSLNTIKSWIKREKARAGKAPKGAPPKKKQGAPLGNKNAVGYGAPAKNRNAVRHGLFSRYLPAETLAIVEELEQSSPLDILYDNILMQHAAIIRAQRIMYVKDQDDITKEVKKVKTSSTGKDGKKKMSELEYELQFAWDKQASYLQAQSRAMQTLTTMIKQFKELTAPDDERRLRLELMEVELEMRRKEADSLGSGGNAVDDWIDVVTGEDEGSDVE
ncbi:phage terminase small subunit [Lacrimispora sp.]|uniref:phage terminase small subunit n=1 Tax=Lacrimispora sp. TaxID=2719234 RepID=UPI0028A6987D|nr:phage terminase small subunit [Lacrimispora sp.]